MSHRGRLAAGIVGCLTLLAIGWTGLLIPSLIRSIESTFGQSDAGIGIVYLAYALAYTAGSFGGGAGTERVGRRLVLGCAVLVHGLGVASLGLAPSWPLFVIAALVAGGGAGCLDGGSNGLVLDVYREGRGRAMNLLHVSFSVGALAAPVTIGALVVGGVPWQMVAVGTGMVVSLLAVAYAVVPMPSGRRTRTQSGARATAEAGATPSGGPRLLAGPLLLLGIAIAAYVASEVGVSNWLVRFLEPAPLQTATLCADAVLGRPDDRAAHRLGDLRPLRSPALHDRVRARDSHPCRDRGWSCRGCPSPWPRSRWPASRPDRSSR